MIGCPHDAPLCDECDDVGFVVDPRSADEDGVPDLLPCPRNCGASEGHMVRGLDQWKCTVPVDDRELEAERAAALDELAEGERDVPRVQPLGPVSGPLEEDDIQW